MPPGTVGRQVMNTLSQHLWGGVVQGYAKSMQTADYDTPHYTMLAMLQKNVWQFSGAQNYQQLRQLTNALINDDGTMRSKQEFLTAAAKITAEYNKYLGAEYDLAVNGAIMAGKWVDIEQQKYTFPLLQFDAVIDSQTTDLCRNLHNTILPAGHAFWNRFYPPNHWGCRSTVRQLTTGAITAPDKIPSADIPPMFQTNLGKQGLLFPQDHPYYQDIPTQVLQQSLSALRKQIKHEATGRLKGKTIYVKNAGDIEITATGIAEILSQPISDTQLYHLKNALVYQADTLLANATVVISNEPDAKGRNFTYDYLEVKGLENFRLVVRKDLFSGLKTLYSMVNKNAD